MNDEDKVATAMSGGVEEWPAKGGAFPLLPLNTDVEHWSSFKGYARQARLCLGWRLPCE
ncbi:MAG: hypothetical protein ACKPKO_60750 [Candidatus Fonsibacter sp.]